MTTGFLLILYICNVAETSHEHKYPQTIIHECYLQIKPRASEEPRKALQNKHSLKKEPLKAVSKSLQRLVLYIALKSLERLGNRGAFEGCVEKPAKALFCILL